MPIYLYWGEDDFALEKAVEALRAQVLDPQWVQFNYDKITPDQPDAVIQGLNQAMTPPFGFGGRLVWLINTTICQQCSEQLLTELERTLPSIPESCTLLLTTPNKPDGRLKSTKLLQKTAEIQEFSEIPPWKIEELIRRVQQVAQTKKIKINPPAAELLAQSVGNDTRQLHNELDKLHLYATTSLAQSSTPGIIDQEAVSALVISNTQNSLQLASTLLQGDAAKGLTLVSDLISHNEPPLRIVATLTGQFRTWLWVKIAIDSGEKDDKAIAVAADVGNPKRIYFLRQEVNKLRLPQLTATLTLLLELEVSLKRGAEPLSTLQTKVIELCQIYRR